MGVGVDFVAHGLSCHLMQTNRVVKITSKATTLDKIVPTTDVHLLINNSKGLEVLPIDSILRTKGRDLMDPTNRGLDPRDLHLKVDVVVVQMAQGDHDQPHPTKALNRGLDLETGTVVNVEN